MSGLVDDANELRALERLATMSDDDADMIKLMIDERRRGDPSFDRTCRKVAALIASREAAVSGECDLCAGKCRGHSLGHPEEWEPEPGSREAAVKPLGDDAGLVDRCAEDVTMMKAVIAEANNSLYGSQSFFMSISGERPAHRYHLAEEIEKLKALSNTRYRQVETLTRELDKAREAGGRLATCAFNLSQRAHLTINERLSLNESREQWDALSATTDLGRDTENAG